MQIKLLCVGDVVGRPGRQVLADHLAAIVKEQQIDCVIVNAENSSGGSGMTVSCYDKMLRYGVNLITMGDHIYRKRELIETLQGSDCIVRPVNLSRQAAGREFAVYTTSRGPAVAVVSVLGRLHMPIPTDNPFHAVEAVLQKIPADVKIIVVDMHAEVTSEKVAMGWFLDGRVSAVFGTHTHVATADETILPKGTAYITDLGMTGPHESVLGRSIDKVLKSLTTQMPYAYSIATGDIRLTGILVTVASVTGKASRIERICVKGTASVSAGYDESDGKPSENHSYLY